MAGHLFSQVDGKVFTNSKDLWRGVPETTFIWHGEWADPEILYKGQLLSSEAIEESLWISYQSDLSEGKIAPNMSFDEWCEEQGTDYLAATLDEFINIQNN